MNRYLQAGMRLKKPECPGEYEIKEIVGTGASCVVYYAEFVDASGVPTEHLLKEYNPRGLRLERDEAGCLHLCSESDASAFEAGLCRFKAGYEMQLNVRRSSHTKNSTSNIQGVFDSNGTRYIDMTVMAGTTYEKVEEENLYNLLKRIEAITKVVSSYHENGLLHLDIKPDNIFVLPETVELVQMFDFDSVIKKTDVDSSAFLSYTQSWAAQEQILPNRRNRICEATDIFAIGEILFYKLMGRHSEAHERRSFSIFTFDYSKELFEGVNPRVFPLLSEIFKHTICNIVTNRYQSTSELLEVLKQAILLADPHEPFLQHHLPSKAAYFVGRDAELQEIEKRLIQNDKLFISGMGGMGKSELVRQYAHAHKEEYDAVIFSVCNTDLESMILDDSLLPICHVRRGDQKDRDYLKEKYSILERLCNKCNKRVLIIVDNFNDLRDNTLSKLLQLNCKILFTTRCDVSEYNYEQLSLGVLGRDYVWDIFRTWYKVKLNSEDRIAVEQILNLYQGHTMAVELIAKQMRASNITPRQMLDKLLAGGFSDSGRESVIHAKDGINAKMNIHSHIRRLFDVAELSEDQVYILANLSLIPPSGIAKRQFHDWCRLDTYEDINELIESGWIRQEEGSEMIFLHPVIADVMLDELEQNFSLCEEMLEIINEAVQKDGFSELSCLRRNERIHLLNYICGRLCRTDSFPGYAINFINAVACHVYEHGFLGDSIANLKKALDVCKETCGLESKLASTLYNTLGSICTEADQFADAEEYLQKALITKQSIYGKIHEDVAIVHDNLSILYSYLGQYKQAEDHAVSALNIRQEKLGNRHIDTARSYNNLSSIYLEAGQLNKAENMLLKSIEIEETKLGRSHPDIATSYCNLGLLYQELGDWDKAEKYYRGALDMRTNLLGEETLHTAFSYINLGSLYFECDKLDRAREYTAQALKIYKTILGADHHLVATCYSNLGMICSKDGEFDNGECFYKKALLIWEKIFGENHPDVANSYNHLGKLYYEHEQYAEAGIMIKKALDIRLNVFGTKHLDTAMSYIDLGAVFYQSNQPQKAVSNYLKAIEIYESIQGLHHPDTALIYNNLGAVYIELEDYVQAEKQLKKALGIMIHIHGRNHKDVVAVYRNFGTLYYNQDQYGDAILAFQNVVEISEDLFGEDHENTILAFIDLGEAYMCIKDYSSAEKCYIRARELGILSLGENHETVQCIDEHLDELWKKMHQ